MSTKWVAAYEVWWGRLPAYAALRPNTASANKKGVHSVYTPFRYMYIPSCHPGAATTFKIKRTEESRNECVQEGPPNEEGIL